MNMWPKRTRVSILIDKIYFKTVIGTGDKVGYFIMTQGSIYQEDRTIINICACNTRLPK